MVATTFHTIKLTWDVTVSVYLILTCFCTDVNIRTALTNMRKKSKRVQIYKTTAMQPVKVNNFYTFLDGSAV